MTRRNQRRMAAFVALTAAIALLPTFSSQVSAQAGWQSGDGSIGNRLWADRDGDGIQDPDEAGQEGIVVELYSDAGQQLAQGATGPGGWWGYTNLTTGRCYVVTVRLAGRPASPTGAGTDSTKDSDIGADGRVRVCLTAERPVRTDIDAGFTTISPNFWEQGTAHLGNRVWDDRNRNGIQDAGEPGIEGVMIQVDALADGEGVNIAGRSGPGGWWGLDRLTAGCYVVEITTFDRLLTLPTRGTDPRRDSDVVPSAQAAFGGTGRSAPVCLTDGQVNNDTDVGLHDLAPLDDPDLATFVPLADVESVSAGYRTTCARLASGRVRCWGYNEFSETGHDRAEFRASTTAVQVDSLVASAIGSGANGACAVRADGGVSCWGDGGQGGYLASTPIPVDGISDAVSVSGTYNWGCAVLRDRTVRCWGVNWSGQLGDGIVPAADQYAWRPPGQVVGLTDVVEVARFSSHSCALRTDGTVWCWGSNSSGQLGAPLAGFNSAVPLRVEGLTSVTDVAVTNESSCATRTDGTVWCWGFTGNGTVIAPGRTVPVPQQVPGVADASTVAIGADLACATTRAGAVWCWGGGGADGERGNGATTVGGPPTRVALDRVATSITVGYGHACAVTVDRTIQCWGDNLYGQIGDGTGTDRLRPATVLRRP